MFAFVYGTGRNGKGVFLNTLTDVMGDYAMASGADVFTASKHERHPTELAALRGARLVVAQEIEDGRAWAEARIKALTGGDPIQARYMRQDFFTFEPEFTLLIAGNHKPRLSTVDPAMRARLHLVPFTVTIPPERRDPRLRERLHEEWPGVMAWIVEGAQMYFAHGLNPPAAVLDATDDYFTAQDQCAEFLEERCELGPDYWEPASAFVAAWRDHCKRNGVRAGTDAEIKEKFQERGLRHHRDRNGSRYLGVQLVRSVVDGAGRLGDA